VLVRHAPKTVEQSQTGRNVAFSRPHDPHTGECAINGPLNEPQRPRSQPIMLGCCYIDNKMTELLLPEDADDDLVMHAPPSRRGRGWAPVSLEAAPSLDEHFLADESPFDQYEYVLSDQ
jgi:hypothetical protein